MKFNRKLVDQIHSKIHPKFQYLTTEQIDDVLDVFLGVLASSLATTGRASFRSFGAFILTKTPKRKRWSFNKGKAIVVQGGNSRIIFSPSGKFLEILKKMSGKHKRGGKHG